MPHHVTQRGTRRQPVFFCDDDYLIYKKILSEWCERTNVKIWAYCLMPNHIHLVAVPDCEQGMSRLVGEAHRRYSRFINKREDWSGHLWQERYFSCVLDECHMLAAVRYVEQNPVRSGLVGKAGKWRWSSARAHIAQKDDDLATVAPMEPYVADWDGYLASSPAEQSVVKIRQGTKHGLPVGQEFFVSNLENRLGMRLRHKKVGRPRNKK